ncbi:DUF6511 domain-containing protein [Neoroseomonas soli]|uniref:Uncharacterized protein n=1 Tax=Neoroseomonas soli TaxID=1081025 RepID=A0A9X9WU86_9PROT|nr:DUF6511 domain-containing protein [Neoroseomonas soli]MBR0670715.1 hypothetical protein [Neoroseomonas soli]
MIRAPEMPCAVCSRPARGFGWFDPAPRKKPRPSACFCCIACQGFWSRLAGRSSAVVDLTEQEKAAMRAALRPLGEIMAEIGWGTRLQDLTGPQVLTLIEVAVGAFQEAMQAIARGQTIEELSL